MVSHKGKTTMVVIVKEIYAVKLNSHINFSLEIEENMWWLLAKTQNDIVS